MKRKIQILFFLILFLVVAVPSTVAMAQTRRGDEIVIGRTFTLRSGETLDGNLIVFGGVANTEANSRITGDVVVFGGTTSIDGRVDGDLVGIGGAISLGNSAWVRGDVTVLGSSYSDSEGTRVDGNVISEFRFDRISLFPFGRVFIPPQLPGITEWRVTTGWQVLWFLFRTFLWAAVAMLVVMFMPNPTDRAARTIVSQPVLAGGVGLLTAVVAPLLLIALAITLILIPVSLLGVAVLIVAWYFGRIVLGLEIGRRLRDTFKQDWPAAVSAGVGTFVLVLVVDGMGNLIPCIGWIFGLLVGVVGLGGVILTRFGTQIYPPESRVIAPQPPSPPVESPPQGEMHEAETQTPPSEESPPERE